MKRYIYYTVVLVLLLLLSITSTLAVVFFLQNNNSRAEVSNLQDELNDLKTARPTPEQRQGGSGTNPSPTAPDPCDNESIDSAIVVESPCRFDVVDSPLNITGTATGLFEGNMIVEIYDDHDVLLHEEVLTLSGGDIGDPIDFDETFEWTPPIPPTTGRVKFYAQSAQDGSDIHVVNIAVRFK
ncbi:MAG: Gmad2 immunoglobulin-like domain-containing protein [Candidatus Dojkabacteria bacterium]